MSLVAKLTLKAMETGIIPEKLIRFWIRRLCKKAIERASLGDVEARHAIFRQLYKELKLGTPLRVGHPDVPSNIEIEHSFFELFLGKRLSMTCSYFPTGAEDLDEAEDTMLWMSADRAGVRDGMNILEIGCEWGAMTLWLAKQYPKANITALTDSTRKMIHLQKQLNELGLTNIKPVAADFEDLKFEKAFDRIICLERFDMLCNLPDWEDRISNCLASDGKFFIQQQVHSELGYYNHSVGLDSLPGNTINNSRLTLSAEMLLMFQKHLHIEDYWKISGEHYHLTAEKWIKKFFFNRLAVLPVCEKVYGKKMAWTWFHRWYLFFIATSELASYNRGQEWIVAQYLFSKR